MKITTIFYRVIIRLWKINPFKKNTARLIKKIKLPVEKIYTDLRFTGEFKIRIDPKATVKIFHHYHTSIENEIFWKGIENGWERNSIKVWKYFSLRAKVIFDIGANTGLFSLISIAVNPNAFVYSFEPSKKTFEKLKLNHQINNFSLSNLYEIAISNNNGYSIFYDYDTSHQYSASLNKQMSIAQASGKNLNYEVKTQSLDSFIKEKGILNIDLIKIDVEMHESEVIEGMEETFLNQRPVILIEILTNEIATYINSFFSDKNYTNFIIDEEKGLFPVNNLFSHSSHNCLLVPSEMNIRPLLDNFNLYN